MMLFFGGAAAVGMMREIIVQARYDSFQRAAERALRGRIRIRSDDDTPWVDPFVDEEFSCFHLCLNCGFLSDSDAGECVGCGKKAWVDLRNREAADSIRKMERRDRREIPHKIQENGRVAGVLLGVAVGLGTYFGLDAATYAGALHLGVTGLATAVTAAAGFGLVPRIWSQLHFRRRRTYPARWHLPVPLPDLRRKPVTTVEGQLKPRTTELLTSPISGKPCLGYEVSVLFDEPHDKRPPMWVLEEEHNIGFEIDGQFVEPDGVTILLPPKQVSSDDWTDDATEVGRFLRRRGLFTSEGAYAVFEALLEPDSHYRVELYDHPKDAAAVIRPA